MQTNDQHRNGTAPAAAPVTSRTSRRLAAARTAARDLQLDAGTWLHLRGERYAASARRAAWRVLGWLLLAFVFAVAIGTATVMLLVGAAGALATTLGTGTAVGAMLVAAAAFVSVGALLALGRVGRPRAEFDVAEARLRGAMQDSVRQLGRGLRTVPGLLLVGVGGVVSVRAMRDRRLRRLLWFAVSSLRTFGRAVATEARPKRAA